MYRHVLIGLEDTPAAWRALEAAIALAQRDGARLTILTALPPVRVWPGGPVETMTAARQLDAELEANVVALQQRALERIPRCLPVTTVIARRAPLPALLARIADVAHDVVVIGDDAAGRRPWWRRSLTRRLQRRAPIPVLVAGQAASPDRVATRPAVVPTRTSAPEAAAVRAS
jgi:nucleotide-binding universal stress UspA family protein